MSFSYPKSIGKVKCFEREHQCPICQGTGICHTLSGSGATCMTCRGTGDFRNARKIGERHTKKM